MKFESQESGSDALTEPIENKNALSRRPTTRFRIEIQNTCNLILE